jgi:hypothetical protein
MLRFEFDGTNWITFIHVSNKDITGSLNAKLNKTIALPNNTDFNSITSEGLFYCNTTTNSPAAVQNWHIMVQAVTDGQYLFQRAHQLGTNKMYVRRYHADAGGWSTWLRQLDTEDYAAITQAISTVQSNLDNEAQARADGDSILQQQLLDITSSLGLINSIPDTTIRGTDVITPAVNQNTLYTIETIPQSLFVIPPSGRLTILGFIRLGFFKEGSDGDNFTLQIESYINGSATPTHVHTENLRSETETETTTLVYAFPFTSVPAGNVVIKVKFVSNPNQVRLTNPTGWGHTRVFI